MGSGRVVSTIKAAGIAELAVDVAIFGSGVAGLSVACSLPDGLDVAVFSKGPYREGSTPFAQGGIAAAIGPKDAPATHASDTLVAAVGLADPRAVQVLTEQAPDAIRFLEEQGALFDRDGDELSLTLEGGHTRPRIVHAGGDATGAEISRALFAMAVKRSVPIVNDAFLVDLVCNAAGEAAGAIVLIEGEPHLVRFGAVVLASGGAGQLFASTTSPSTCTGDGMAVAYRAGAELCDLEFVQFHPTVLASANDPRPLISEALRGEGAVLLDDRGERVMEGLHALGDLAPRDVVARAMVQLMHARGLEHLYLDAREIAGRMEKRFPTISATLAREGIDPAHDLIPVSPASHYSIGGVRTTIDGETSIARLYAAGEVASVGIHGANRLASNSLLEGVVFGRRIAHAIESTTLGRPGRILWPDEPTTARAAPDRERLRSAMDRHAGVVRTEQGLQLLRALTEPQPGVVHPSQSAIETENMAQLAHLAVVLAAARLESRGAHFRLDCPESDPSWQVRQVVRRTTDGEASVSLVSPASTDGSRPTT